MSVSPVPADPGISTPPGTLTTTWRAWFESVYYWLRPVGSSGTTTNRPVTNSRTPLYIGQTYFDTSLGKPIWVKSLNPTVWCDATGASV
jgi:hypothetical protein